jgi:UDP-N-acetyl-D-glucosamine dehydrogenase
MNKKSKNKLSSNGMKVSVNPFSKKEYLIPSLLDDKDNIQEFLKKNKGKKVIVVQGQGYVGSVMSVVCANAISEEYAVIGIDLANESSFWKIKSINDGIFPIFADDPKIEQFYRNALHKGNFYSTFDNYAFSVADVIIVDVNLDVNIDYNEQNEIRDYDLDIDIFKKAIQTISDFCKSDVLVLVESTVPPGTTEQIVYPVLKEGLNKRGLSSKEIKLGHSSERVMPGPNYIDSIQNFYRVYSGIDIKSADASEDFLKTIISTEKYPLTRLSSTNATEMSKVLENSYRAANIAFMVEWTRFAEESGVNLYEIIDAIRMRPTHSNMMYPGIGVGGYCLTKDTLLASWSKKNLFNSNTKLVQSEKSISINNTMPHQAFNFLISKYSKKVLGDDILLLGVSYRGDVSDTRFSPVESFYDNCKRAGLTVFLHDPFVSYWEEKQLNISHNLGEIIKPNFDTVVITSGHSFYKSRKFIDHLIMVKPKIIYDTLGHIPEEYIKRLQKVSKVIVLGRDDLS